MTLDELMIGNKLKTQTEVSIFNRKIVGMQNVYTHTNIYDQHALDIIVQ